MRNILNHKGMWQAFAFSLILTANPVKARFMPAMGGNPFCSPGLMLSMLQAQGGQNPAAEERALNKQIKQLEEKMKEGEKDLKEDLQKGLDKKDDVLYTFELILEYQKYDSPEEFDNTVCGQGANLQCKSNHQDCRLWKRWRNCASSDANEFDHGWNVDITAICNKQKECLHPSNNIASCKKTEDTTDTPICNYSHSSCWEGDPFSSDPTSSCKADKCRMIRPLSPQRERDTRGRPERSRRPTGGGSGERDNEKCNKGKFEQWENRIKKIAEDEEALKELQKQLEDLTKAKTADDPYSMEDYWSDYDGKTAADENCMSCRESNRQSVINQMERWYKPDKWQRFGQFLSSAAGVALGLYSIKSANKVRARLGFPGQAGYGMQLAYPFIMDGLYGSGMLGSSLACSPTGSGFRNVLGGLGGLLMGGYPGMGYPGGGIWGGGYPGGFPGMGGYPGGFPGMGYPGGFPGMGYPGGFPGMGYPGGFPGIGGGIHLGGGFPFPGGGFPFPGGGIQLGGGYPGGFPGMGYPGGFPGMGYPGGFPGIGGGIHLGGGFPFPGGGFPGMGGYPGGFPGMGYPGGGFPGGGFPGGGMMGGGFGQMQAYMEYQKAMMSYKQAQMNNWMQKQQSVQALTQEMYRLQMQIQEVMYGGGASSGFSLTAGGQFHTSIGGGGDRTSTRRGGRSPSSTRKRGNNNRRRFAR